MNVTAWEPQHVPAAPAASTPAAQTLPHLAIDAVGPAPATHGADVPDSANAPLVPMTPADELLDKIKQLEGEVESLKNAKLDPEGEIESPKKDKEDMKDAFGVLKVQVDDQTSFYNPELKVLKGKVADLEPALTHN